MEDKLGLELEVLILEELEDGRLAPADKAPELLEALPDREDSLGGYEEECSLSMLEIVTKPDTLQEVGRHLVDRINEASEVAEEKGLRLMPLDTYPGDFSPLLRREERYNIQKSVFGEDGFRLCGNVLGQHTHFSISGDDLIDQLNYLSFLDPVSIAVTSSSPGDYLENERIHMFRHELYEGVPFSGHLRPLKTSFAEYEREVTENFEKFKEIAREKGVEDMDGMTPFNTLRGPVSINPDYFTLESRTSGSNPDLALLMGYVALSMGGMRRVLQEENPLEQLSRALPEGSLEEQYHSLLDLSDEATVNGLQSPEVRDYARAVFEYAFEGLSSEEENLVEPVHRAIETGINTAQRIRGLEQVRKLGAGDGSDLVRTIYNTVYQPSLESMEANFRPARDYAMVG